MAAELRYPAGSVVVLREIWESRIWGAHPMIVVQDTPDLVALYRPSGARSKRRRGLNGKQITGYERKHKLWTLADAVRHDVSVLRLTVPDEAYSVLVFRDTSHGNFMHWYINLEEPQRRTLIGFDYTDSILDVVVEPDLTTWRWLDEDELDEAVALEIVPREKVGTLYAKGAEARDLIMSGHSPFNSWERWYPDPSWGVPVLPEGWDLLSFSESRQLQLL